MGRSTWSVEWVHHPQHHETWERPHYTRLHLPVLRRLQRTLLRGLRGVWDVIRERVRAGLADMLRR